MNFSALRKIIIIAVPFVVHAHDCIVRRAAFDIGSASTKLKVADVDTCLQKVVKVIYEEEQRVDFAQNLENSSTHSFNAEIQAQGVKTLIQLRKKAQDLGASEFAGVATAAFRDSKNSSDLIQKFSS